MTGVFLSPGIVLPLEAVTVALDLERRGYRVERIGDELVINPRAMLTREDREAVARWRWELVQLVRHCEAEW